MNANNDELEAAAASKTGLMEVVILVSATAVGSAFLIGLSPDFSEASRSVFIGIGSVLAVLACIILFIIFTGKHRAGAIAELKRVDTAIGEDLKASALTLVILMFLGAAILTIWAGLEMVIGRITGIFKK
jgi:hypothetical protein